MTTTSCWANYLSNVCQTDIPASVEHKAKLHLLDTLAAIVSGCELSAGQSGQKMARRLGGDAEVTVFSKSPFRCGAIQAATANAMAAHADETDDSHLRGRFHPGCSIVPAALAVAELYNRTGKELLRAIAAGYDFGARAVLALGIPEHDKPRFSTHTIGGHWGAAAAAIALSGMSSEQATWALSYTAQQVSGIPYWRQDKDHIEKSFDFGAMAARNALFTVLAIESGWTGCNDVLDGPESYLSAFGHHPKPEELTAELGQRFEIELATIKKWCVGSPIQAVLDSTKFLIDQYKLRSDDISEILITMPDDRIHIVDNRDMPDVCVQHLVALAILDGTVGFAAAHDYQRMQSSAVLAIRDKIVLEPSRELTLAKPARQATVRVTLKSGEIVAKHTKAVLGTPENPMSTDQVCEKAEDLLSDLLGLDKATKVIQAFTHVDSCVSVKDLVRELF
jgi:2-methylcitrate dehydratase PrpD